MKLATGLWVWVSLLLAAGTVQPNASQSGGSCAVPSRAPVVEPAPAAWAASGGSLAPFREPETRWFPGTEGPLHPGLFRGLSFAPLSVPKLNLFVCLRFIYHELPLCAPIPCFSLLNPPSFFLARFLPA